MRLTRLRPPATSGPFDLVLGLGAPLLGLLLVQTQAGCGLRSDPLFMGDTDVVTATDSDTEDTDTESVGSSTTEIEPPVEGRLGSCTNPIDLPTTDSSASGTLRGPGLYTGECGGDSGLEDVYRFTPTAATDVTIVFDESTEFTPTVRVLDFGCLSDEGVLRVCTDDWFVGSSGRARHFLALGNREYFIHIDSEEGDGGDYAFDVILGPPPIDQCEPHPEVIFQQPGSIFRWENDFTGGQGYVDSACGGIGRENLFPLEASYPGNVTVTAFGFEGFQPVVGVRRDCSAITEFECASERINGTPGQASVTAFLDTPGRYYINVDSLVLDPGIYSLEVAFD